MYNNFTEEIEIKTLPKKKSNYYRNIIYGYVVEFNFKYRTFFIDIETAITFMWSGRKSYGITSCGMMKGMIEKNQETEILYYESDNCKYDENYYVYDKLREYKFVK